MKSIYNYSEEKLQNHFLKKGFKKYNGRQVIEWLYKKRVLSFDEMTNISKGLRAYLKDNFDFLVPKIILMEEDLDTRKFLLELKDGSNIEAVVMNHTYGLSLCVSTQVGCNMGCQFCESGKLKKRRNLEVYEMIGTVLEIEKKLDKRISHVVLMGIGEPFDNFENVLDFLRLLNNPYGMEIGARHITVSTCGIVPKIIEFSKFPLQVNLAISLHSAVQKTREKLMPIAKVYNLDELFKALKIYQEKTKRRITFEYILLEKVNDSEEEIKALIDFVKPFNAYINLIPYNETSEDFRRSSEENIKRIYDIIKASRIDVTRRQEFGKNISAACGQLSARKES